MPRKQLDNVYTLSHLRIDANGVVLASFKTFISIYKAALPLHSGENLQSKKTTANALTQQLNPRRKTVDAGAIYYAAKALGTEQALTCAVESVRLCDWNQVPVTAVEHHVWQEWRHRREDYRGQVRCLHLLQELRTLVDRMDGVRDSSPARYVRQQGGNQDV